MKQLEIYDPAMCCSTGVCGPQPDSALVRFAADVKWVEAQGIEVGRFNLSQSPAAFVANDAVRMALTEKGEAALPMVLVSGKSVCVGRYPGREELAGFLGLNSRTDIEPTESKTSCCCGTQRE